jgi:E3 ubiquitin-protein ligase RNF14
MTTHTTSDKHTSMADAYDEREEELESIIAIFPEIILQGGNSASIDLPVTPSSPLLVRFVAAHNTSIDDNDHGNHAHVEHDVRLAHLPSLKVQIDLPEGYPSDQPPSAKLATEHDWLPSTKIHELEQRLSALWEDLGRCQTLYSYIDELQQAAEQGFDLDQRPEGCLTLPTTLESQLVEFNKNVTLSTFNEGTFDCGICLEPKKGASCYKLDGCGHVFCKQCLQDFYNNAIKEGDSTTVTCLDPSCGKALGGVRNRREKKPLHPRELLAMGISEPTARRYVEMKRKKRLESDKNTIYCPREHCKHPARSSKYPPIPSNLADYPDSDSDSEDAKAKTSDASYDPNDRLAVCENPKCRLAFCRVCYKSWHGPYERCHPRDPKELSAEEQASYDYIAANTSPCPYCNAATSKTMGCNHMKCCQCSSHFCYLCGSWLDADNPYQHFNKAGSPCYQRLWDMEGGDNGEGNEFLGARHWEQMARDVARLADEEDARALQLQEDALAGEQIVRGELAAAAVAPPVAPAARVPPAVVPPFDPNDPAVLAAEAHAAAHPNPVGMVPPPPPARRGRGHGNPFRPVAAAGRDVQGAAIRAYERGGGVRGRPAGFNGRAGQFRAENALQEFAREEGELQRFVELALRNEEDDWDSDELGDDEDFVIR